MLLPPRCAHAGSDWQNGKCCGDGLQCTMFAGQGFGIPATIENACLPRAAPAGVSMASRTHPATEAHADATIA